MRTKAFIPALCGLLFVMASCSNERTHTAIDTMDMDSPALDSNMVMGMAADTAMYETAHADLSGTKADTTVMGTAHFTRKGDKVALTLKLEVPKKANQTVAVHFHEHGDCGDMGEGAHGHWNPTGEQHGKWGSAQYHSGDLGNIKLDKDGKATFTVETDRWMIGGNSDKNVVGRAIIVHSGVDDYKTQPTGNSGTRIGCGVIKGM